MRQAELATVDRSATGASLVSRFLGEDRHAAAALHRHLLEVVRGTLRRCLPRNADLEDASQEVFLCLYRRLPALEAPEQLASFAKGIAIRVALSELRRQRRRPRLELGGVEHIATPALRPPTEEQRTARQAFDALSLPERQMLWGRAVEGARFRELAEQHDVSMSTAKRRFNVARRRVAASLGLGARRRR